LGEGIDDIVGAVATESLVFALIKNLYFGGAVGLGKYLGFGRLGFEGDTGFGGIFVTAGGADKFFAGFHEAVIDGLALEQGVCPAFCAYNFN